MAKELGVQSTAIVKKCQDEGIDEIKNHMTAIGPGLAATIKEWFSEGAHTTTEEITEKVDLEKVRIRKKAKPIPEQPVETKPAEAVQEEIKAGPAVETQVLIEEEQKKKI